MVIPIHFVLLLSEYLQHNNNKLKWIYDHRSCECNLSNCKPEYFSGLKIAILLKLQRWSYIHFIPFPQFIYVWFHSYIHHHNNKLHKLQITCNNFTHPNNNHSFLCFLTFSQWLSILVSARQSSTVEPRYNDTRYNDVPGITINIWQPGKCYIGNSLLRSPDITI